MIIAVFTCLYYGHKLMLLWYDIIDNESFSCLDSLSIEDEVNSNDCYHLVWLKELTYFTSLDLAVDLFIASASQCKSLQHLEGTLFFLTEFKCIQYILYYSVHM